MNRAPMLLALLVGCVFVCSAEPAQAQFYGRDASAFLLNPYMGLYPPYSAAMSTYIRPRMMELQRTLAGQTASLQRQEAGLRGLREQVSRIGQPGGARPTGTGSTFMNYSHYYPGLGAGGRGAPRPRTYSVPRRSYGSPHVF